ncbi:MAG: hypothetical protein HY391_06775 [Deltaproteobacteria bacterium]|nr:hypothetical protein [Deltaproteobacteria bacterium]
MRKTLFLITLLLFIVPDVYAYIDPGTGSYFFQFLIATLLGTLFFWKTLWLRMKRLFSRIVHKFF